MLGLKKHQSARVDTLVGQNTEVFGDVIFSGGLHVDGKIVGNVRTRDESGGTLTLSEHGRIEGDVKVSHIVLNGEVRGDVYAYERIELAPQARIQGNVYYNLLEMAMGAEVNGSLVHKAGLTQDAVSENNIENNLPTEMQTAE